jgi:hypothetical protein
MLLLIVIFVNDIFCCLGYSGASTLTRAAYAQLSSAGYASITDRHGNPPQVIDAAEVVPLNIEHEVTDSLQANEIAIQFLALSRSVL